MAASARGIYVTRRPYLLGDSMPSCSAGEVIVDYFGDGMQIICVPNSPDVIQTVLSEGGRIVGYAGGSSPRPGVSVTLPPTTGGGATTGSAATAGGSNVMQTLERATGLNGSSLAIGMVVLLLLTRKR